MRIILLLLASLLAGLRDILARLISKPSFGPVLQIVGNVRDQVDAIASVFDKAPCSATGGTA
jgi:hypothetical protein